MSLNIDNFNTDECASYSTSSVLNDVNLHMLKSIATPLVSVSTIASDPTKMIPVNPGQSIHHGYEPIDEEEAFLLARKKSYFPIMKMKTQIRILRENTTANRLVQLCHKFNCLNWGINVIVPKDEFLNSKLQKCIFKSIVIYNSHIDPDSYAKIHIEITATHSQQFDLDEYVIWVNRLNGSSDAHCTMFCHLKKYIEADGNMDPRINRQTQSPPPLTIVDRLVSDTASYETYED
jgi:hypothetical protein